MVGYRAVGSVLFIALRQVAAEDATVLNQLLAAYKRIGLKLPTLDLSNALKAHPDCQHALAVIYSIILEFHTWAYRHVRRRGEHRRLREYR